MTITAGPARMREALAAPALRRSLAALVRRRVPAGDVEDVAQTILCDALSSSSVPTDPEDLRRFVVGIARHKVADFHRRARRTRHEEASELVVPPPPVEARALLGRIATSVSSDREQETLEWLVREHAGEQLQTIAEDAGLPPTAVRQRVSRLRRVLRAQWGHALALLLVAGGCAVLTERAQRARSSIVADPSADPDPIARAASVLQGKWRVEHLAAEAPGDPATASREARAALEAKVVDVQVTGRRLQLSGPMFSATRTLTAVSARPDGSVEIELQDERGAVQHATATFAGPRMHLTVHDGRWRGAADLVR